MIKYKSFLYAAVFAILFLCSIESQSATLAKRTTCYVGEVKQSDIRMSIRLTLENSKIGTLNVSKRHADLGKNKIEEFYLVSLESDTLILSGELVYDIKYLFKREKQSACICLIGASPDGILFCDKDIRRITLRSTNEKKTANLFLNRIIDGDFFEQEQSEERDYILVVQHCLLHTDESYDETFADGLCQMLQKYPKKIEGVQKAMEYLSPKHRETAYYNMMVYIVSAWKMEQDSDVIDYNRFYKVYPFFEKNPVIDRILCEQVP